jgi:hypothetical protein
MNARNPAVASLNQVTLCLTGSRQRGLGARSTGTMVRRCAIIDPPDVYRPVCPPSELYCMAAEALVHSTASIEEASSFDLAQCPYRANMRALL